MYLPQFHCIPENDEFWGKGFTDWVTVKKAKPLFEGHQQPKVPLNDNYYDLSKEENVKWQAKLAKNYGIYGFGVYHYWFNNEKNLLTKPAEILRDLKDENAIKYFFVWDNCNWKRSWSNVAGNDWAPIADNIYGNINEPQILVPYILGGERDWVCHYNYLREHFLSDNYEKRNNRPVFGIIWSGEAIYKMCDYLNNLARKDGFDGIEFVFKNNNFSKYPPQWMRYDYEPHYVAWGDVSFVRRVFNKFSRVFNIPVEKEITCIDFDKTWKKILKRASTVSDKNIIDGAFVGYDDSPRRGRNKSKVIVGGTPQKFSKYLGKLLEICSRKNSDYIFLTAWNEWGEGAYLEPDTLTEFGYLDAIDKAVKSVK